MPEAVAVVPKNSREELRIVLDQYQGVDIVNLRIWYASQDGEYRPSKAGFAMRVAKLPEVRQALQQAEDEARARGLLDGA